MSVALRVIRGGAAPPADDDDGDGRPWIRVTPEIHQMAQAAERALASITELEIYQRGGALVRVIRADDKDKRKRALGAPYVRELSPGVLRGELARCSRWCTTGPKGRMTQVRPDKDAMAYLLGRGSWTHLDRLEGILEVPALRADGTVIEGEGYDPATGFLLAPGDAFVPVMAAPSREDAKEALRELIEPFQDFPHAGEEEGLTCGPARAAAISAILTLLAVPAIDGSLPAFVFDASLRRSGKSLQTDVIALIATGRGAPRQSWPEEDEEAEKTLSGYALAGDPLVCFDNLRRCFGGAKLEACVTAVPGSTVPFRRFGTQEIVKLPWRTVILASGNNVTLSPDIAQRSLVIRIEPDREDPERRVDFRIPGGADGLRAWVMERRPRLVRAALTLLRAWHLAGRPCEGVAPMGGFEAWRRIVPAALVWAGAADPIAAVGGHLDGDDSDPLTEALRVVVEFWPRLEAVVEGLSFGDEPSGRGITASAAIDTLRRKDGPPDGFDDLREALGELTRTAPGRLEARAVGVAFREHRRRPIDGRRITPVRAAESSRKSKRWTVEAVRR